MAVYKMYVFFVCFNSLRKYLSEKYLYYRKRREQTDRTRYVRNLRKEQLEPQEMTKLSHESHFHD
jgi:hypothetical protein